MEELMWNREPVVSSLPQAQAPKHPHAPKGLLRFMLQPSCYNINAFSLYSEHYFEIDKNCVTENFVIKLNLIQLR